MRKVISFIEKQGLKNWLKLYGRTLRALGIEGLDCLENQPREPTNPDLYRRRRGLGH